MANLPKPMLSDEFGQYGDVMSPQCIPHLEPLKEKVLEIFDEIVVDSTFNIGDFGCADGATSMSLIGNLVALVKDRYGEYFPVNVFYEDLCYNDFNTLFKRLSGMISKSPSYTQGLKEVYTFASGVSFYDQVVSSKSMNVIFCLFASGALSQKAPGFQNSLYRFPAGSSEEKQKFAKQMANDWERFLQLRARELKTGGYLIMTVSCEDPEMKFCGFKMHKENIILGLTSLWRTFRQEGKISAEEFTNTNHYACCRTVEEIMAPFKNETSPGRKAGLNLISLDIQARENVLKRRYREAVKTEDGIHARRAFAKEVAHSTRTWSNTWFENGLSDTRSEEEKTKLLNEFYERLEEVFVEMEPEDIRFDNIYAYVVIRKGIVSN